MTDLLALGFIGAMAYLGRKRGLAGMVFLAGGLVGGYVAALVLFRPIGRLIAGLTGLPTVLGYVVAGMGVLVATSGILSRLARKHRRERDFKVAEGWEPPPSDELGGMALGAAYGLVIAIVLAWAGMSLTGLYAQRDLEGVRASVTGRLSTEVTQRAVAIAARSVVGDRFVSNGVGSMVADPYRAIAGLNGIMADERMQTLLRSGAFQEAARLQDPGLLARHPALNELADDDTFAQAMRTFGLARGGEGPVDPAEIAEAIVREAGPALRSVDALASDPEVGAILESSAFRQQWEAGDFMQLAQTADFQRLFDRVLTELRRSR